MGGLRRDSPVALYYQLKQRMFERILAKEWQPGEKIPTEDVLGREYRVSRITVRQALSELVREGYLLRRQGKGTYVTVPLIEQSFTVLWNGASESRTMDVVAHTRVIEFHQQSSDMMVSERLHLTAGKDVYRIMCLRYAGNVVMAVETTFLPADLMPGLTKTMLRDHPLHDVMRDTYGIAQTSVQESLGAVLMTAEEALHFDLQPGAAAVDIERVTYEGEQRIDFTRSVMRGDKVRLRVQLR